MGLILDLATIAAGLILGAPLLAEINIRLPDSAQKALEEYRWLVGALCLLLGFIALINPGFLIAKLVALCAGLLLLGERLSQVPAIGEGLYGLAERLRPHEPIVGIAALLVGLLGLFNVGLLSWP